MVFVVTYKIFYKQLNIHNKTTDMSFLMLYVLSILFFILYDIQNKQQHMLVVKLKTFSMSADDFTENRTMTNHFPYCVFDYNFFSIILHGKLNISCKYRYEKPIGNLAAQMRGSPCWLYL